MKYYIIAGEASGDLHGSNLIRELRVQDPDAHIRCWGGDLMQEAGGTLARHYKSMAFMGFFEVIANLGSIFRNISYCKEDIEEFNPDVVIFIDFSGFNLRIAKWAKAKGYRTNYYISPQIWASRENRIKKIKRDIDAMYVILPFEKDFYEKKHDFPVHFVGHPLIDAIANTKAEVPEVTRKQLGLAPDKKVIALLPGSRVQEVQKTLDVMLSVARGMDEYQFVIAGAPSLEDSFYEPFTRKGNVSFVKNRTYELLGVAHAALVTSGTATLETALFNVPQVVCYNGNWISYQIAKRIITLDYISLVNLVMGKEVVKELIQGDLTTANLREELNKILEGPVRQEQLKAYEELRKKLGGRGASKEAASLIIAGLKDHQQ
ncbi:lipid-A-disaccharide synthase [Zeaxanthinibacter enoshimensis]|uniref:Lipid-A-disaccharide synthase n=1 Tax=Zeaxanthinibacter enoshimensis TaxID=392009 RepID=A0A4R6TTR3_9FLAO|nr:lipid-A-disaccharide synthase [Zeaxanthinibacter enoshimensis]TDQ33319.1 lipid-A-disaccharide synthase [Zeaxanthinibacter enoshimensis]